jgi:prolyl 4-hydroxylase
MNHQALYPWPTKVKPITKLSESMLVIAAEMTLPKAIVLENFLSNEECNDLIELALPAFKRSEVISTTTGQTEVYENRTSDGMFLRKRETPTVEKIERRICEAFNWQEERTEALQVLRYMPGTHYQAHHDYFNLSYPGTPNALKRGGQRVATLLMYLKTPEEGGETFFPESGLSVQAIKGNAVLFVYEHADDRSKTLHAGSPVTKGVKFVATKWFRQGVFV